MLDLEAAIRRWRAPFVIRGWYSTLDVDELEQHLRDVVADETAHGASEEEALRLAIQRVGDEVRLRSQFRMEWREKNPVRKYWLRLKSEGAGLNGRGGQLTYILGRGLSVALGVFSLLVLISAIRFLSQGVPFWSMGRPIAEQGMLFSSIWGLQSMFNMLPFGRWENRAEDWLRLIYTAMVFWMVTVVVFFMDWQMFAFAMALGIGPMLWLNQLFRRREPA
ncbi:hypothetical protein JYT20_01680 [Rhodothermus sp. AH-315-K08]|nr:hypothetical protein [Rhodothermus sp. AH-315-K08]